MILIWGKYLFNIHLVVELDFFTGLLNANLIAVDRYELIKERELWAFKIEKSWQS